MPLQFKINITKAILTHCKFCGCDGEKEKIGNNCAIAIALIDIFPEVYVTDDSIFPFGKKGKEDMNLNLPLPAIARQFIKLFDGFRLTPQLRQLLTEFDFEIDIPDEVIEQINIDEIRRCLESTKKSGINQAVTSFVIA